MAWSQQKPMARILPISNPLSRIKKPFHQKILRIWAAELPKAFNKPTIGMRSMINTHSVAIRLKQATIKSRTMNIMMLRSSIIIQSNKAGNNSSLVSSFQVGGSELVSRFAAMFKLTLGFK